MIRLTLHGSRHNVVATLPTGADQSLKGSMTAENSSRKNPLEEPVVLSWSGAQDSTMAA